MHCLPTDKFLLNNVHGKHIWQHFFKCTLKWQITHHFSKIAQQQQQHLQQQQLQQQSCGAKLGATVAVAAKLACRDVWPEPHVIMASVCAGKVCNAGFLTDMINDHSTLTYFLCKCKISLIKLYIVVFFLIVMKSVNVECGNLRDGTLYCSRRRPVYWIANIPLPLVIQTRLYFFKRD